MTLELYHGLASTCSKKVRLCLYEKGLDFASHVINLQKFEQHTPEYLKLNPKGVVPTLVHNGVPIVESSRIIEYIDTNFLPSSLQPSDQATRNRMRKWIDWSDNVGYDAVYAFTWEILSRPVAQRLPDDELDRILDRVPTDERRTRWKLAAREGFGEQEFRAAHEKMLMTLSEMERDLRDSPWLAGGTYSLADIAMVPFVERIFDLKPELRDGSRIPAICSWFDRIERRPAFTKAFFFNGIDTRVNAIRRLQIEQGLIPADSSR